MRPDLDALAALLDKATPGPWDLGEFDEQGGYDCMTSGIGCGPAYLDGNTYGEQYGEPFSPAAKTQMMADAALIVAAVNALPALIARVRELERERDQSTLNRACADALVSAAQDMTRAAALAMRERCAEACDDEAHGFKLAGEHEKEIAARDCAAAIRALET